MVAEHVRLAAKSSYPLHVPLSWREALPRLVLKRTHILYGPLCMSCSAVDKLELFL